jgi:NAD(P)-dependent dehydrogenase (short-subunit alcohol dehydrogenase family)
MSDKEFDGQVAVVTGGGVGIGFAIAKLFAERGATASIWDIDGEAAAAAAKRLKEAGLKAHSQQLDVTDEKQILAARDATLADCGQIDILVNNAGLYPEGTIQEMTREAWDRVFAVNVTGPFFLMRALMEHMKARKYGRMVNIVTVDAYMPKQTKPHYAASKAALLSVMKTYAIELAPHGILVNGVSPGAVATERAKQSDWLEPHSKKTPVGYAAEPEQMAEYILFLASRRNMFMAGECIIASGGFYVASA